MLRQVAAVLATVMATAGYHSAFAGDSPADATNAVIESIISEYQPPTTKPAGGVPPKPLPAPRELEPVNEMPFSQAPSEIEPASGKKPFEPQPFTPTLSETGPNYSTKPVPAPRGTSGLPGRVTGNNVPGIPAGVDLPGITSDPVHGIIKELVETDAEVDRKVQDLLAEARALLEAGKQDEALAIVAQAQKLAPAHPAVTAFVRALQRPAPPEPRQVSSNQVSKAKAHVAAAVTRGKELIREGRHQEGIDLLQAVLQTVPLFPENSGIDLYQKLATEELQRLAAAVQAGQVVLQSPGEDPGAVVAAPSAQPPENLPRLIRSTEDRVPAWYGRMKARLGLTMSADYQGTPANRVWSEISRVAGVPIYVDPVLLRGQLDSSIAVDMRVINLPAEKVLDLSCYAAGVEYVITERAVVVTTPAKAIVYVRHLPEILRYEWGVARVLFPEFASELFQSAPAAAQEQGNTIVPASRAQLDRYVPSYLRSGQALLDDIKALLR